MNNMFDLNQGSVVNLKKIDKILNEKATVLKTFNNVILELTYEADVDTLQTEIQDSSNLQIVYQNTVQWCIEWQRVATNDNKSYNKWQRVVTQVTTSGTTNDSEWSF